MIHVFQLSVPPDTPINEPVSETIKLTKGRLTQITVQFLPGPCNLVGVWFEYHSQKILPWNKTGVLYGDNNTLPFQFLFNLDTDPYELIMYGYSLDDIFSHTVYVTLNLEAVIVERIANLKVS